MRLPNPSRWTSLREEARRSVRVRPNAESALAALQMRLRAAAARARCNEEEEGRKEGPKEDLAVAAAAFIFQLIFLLSPSLSYALRSSPRNAVLCRCTDALEDG